MTAARGVTAEELVRALKRRKATLPAEIGTFVALESCEALLATGPCATSLSTVHITDEGLVRVEGASPADEEGAAQALHGVLTSLLVAAGPAPAPALMRLVEEGPSGGVWTLAQMRDDLEASLVPLNRKASRRVLARLVRETSWVERPSARPAGPTFRELDRELSSLLGVEPPPESPQVPAATAPPRNARDHDATVQDEVDDVDPAHDDLHFLEEAASAPASATGMPAASVVGGPPELEPVIGHGRLRGLADLDNASRAPAGRGAFTMGLWLVLLAVALAGVTLVLRPDVRAKLPGATSRPVSGSASGEAKNARAPVTGGDLVVHVSPDRAQVLRFVGHGPLTVPHLPLGVAHEFVAIGEGLAPTRVVIPPGADWESTPDGPRYELAMQLGAPLAPGAPLDLGETRLPADVGRSQGALGSVRIVTTPRGAKVYQVIGFAPEARVQDLALDTTEELLVFRPGYPHVVRVVSPRDFVEHGGRKVAEVTIALSPPSRRR